MDIRQNEVLQSKWRGMKRDERHISPLWVTGRPSDAVSIMDQRDVVIPRPPATVYPSPAGNGLSFVGRNSVVPLLRQAVANLTEVERRRVMGHSFCASRAD